MWTHGSGKYLVLHFYPYYASLPWSPFPATMYPQRMLHFEFDVGIEAYKCLQQNSCYCEWSGTVSLVMRCDHLGL